MWLITQHLMLREEAFALRKAARGSMKEESPSSGHCAAEGKRGGGGGV
jgi:hypothetical protein